MRWEKTSQYRHYLLFFVYFPFLISKEIITRHPHYAIFFFISLSSLLLQYEAGNFKPIIFQDSPYPIDPVPLISKFSSVWRDLVNFGYSDPSGPFLSIFYTLLSPLYILTDHNIVITQFIFLFIIFNFTLITSYHLVRYTGIGKIFSILASILYLANPYSIFYVWRILNGNIFLYAALPLILLSILKIVRNENPKKYVLLLLFAELLSLPAFANMAWYLPFLFVTLPLSLSYSFVIRRSSTHLTIKKILLRNLVISILLISPISAFLVTYLQSQPIAINRLASTQTTLTINEGVFNDTEAHVDLASLFSLTGLRPLYQNGVWFNYEHIYLSDIRIFIGLAVTFVIFIVLSFKLMEKKGINKNIYSFIIILVIFSILLLKETSYPIFKNFPVPFLLFRESYMKLGFGFVLALIILFCYCADEIFKIRINKKYNIPKLALIFIILLPVAYWTFPFISGNFMPTQVKVGNLHTFSAFTDLPYRYMPAISYLKQDKDVVSGNARVLIYPLMIHSLWGLCQGNTYWGNDILRFSGISTISTAPHVNFDNEANFLTKLYDISFLQDPNYVNSIANLGIKYIFVQKHPCPNGMVVSQFTSKSDEQNDVNAWDNLSKRIEDKMNTMPTQRSNGN